MLIKEKNEVVKQQDTEIEKLRIEIDKINNEIDNIKNQISLLNERKGRIDYTQLIKEPTSSLYPVAPKKKLNIFIAGIFGYLILKLELSSPFGLPATPLFPALAGLFGVATLFDSIRSTSGIPKQKITRPALDNKETLKNEYLLELEEWLNELTQSDPRREIWFKLTLEDYPQI